MIRKAKRNIQAVSATLSAVMVLAPALPALGAGFQINEHSARHTGMASSVVATVSDAAAVFHNPAGLTSIEGTDLVAGLNLIVPHANYVGPGYPGSGGPTSSGGQDLVNDPVAVPYVYAGRQLSEQAFIGLGFYLPYGSSYQWRNEDTFVGRTSLQELGLQTFFFTPTVAIKFNENVSVAVGASLVPATLLLRREIGASDNNQPLFANGSTFEGSGSAFGVGANAGIQVKLLEDRLRIGFVYKSAINLAFSGNANFTVPTETPTEVQALFPDQGINGELTLPHTFGLGLGWVEGGFKVEGGAQLTLWESYDELALNFEDGLPSADSVTPRDWENVFLIRLGAEYAFGKLALRAGAGFDFSPIPDETVDFTLADNDRILATLGVGYDFGLLRADLGYMMVYLLERELDPAVNVNVPVGGTFSGGPDHVMSFAVASRF